MKNINRHIIIKLSLKQENFVHRNNEVNFKRNTRLPVTRWVKLSLNFELLVPK